MKKPDFIGCVFFDAGGTLLEPWPSVGEVYALEAKKFNMLPDPEAIQKRFAQEWKREKQRIQVEGGMLFGKTEEEAKAFWRNIVEASFADQADLSQFDEFFESVFREFGRADHFRVFEDVAPVLHRLKKIGVQIGVISNWDQRLHAVMEGLGLSAFLDTVVVSYEAGFEKPSPEIFRIAAERAKIEPERVLHIGDSLNEDYHGALKAGFHSLLIDREKRYIEQPVDRLDSLSDLF